MTGDSEMRINVTMDSTQARAESKRLHEELSRRYRAPDEKDLLRRQWDRATGMPPNPLNPELPYEQERHTGIWWEKQRGIKGLGSEQYRHQWFSERDAKYMGLQFGKTAQKELVTGAKSMGIALAAYIGQNAIESHYGWAMMPGRNNRALERSHATSSGAMGGAAVGGGLAAGALALLGLIGAPLSGGLSLALTAGAVGIGAGAGAYYGRDRAKINERNADETERIGAIQERYLRENGRALQFSDTAFQRQLEMTTSRAGKMKAIDAQLDRLNNGGTLSIKNLEGIRDAMLNGGEFGGHKYRKGDLDTAEGQSLKALLQQQYSRRESLIQQKFMAGLTPYAKPMDAVTDTYSQRGLFVGAQVNSNLANDKIIDKMNEIYRLLERAVGNPYEERENKTVFR